MINPASFFQRISKPKTKSLAELEMEKYKPFRPKAVYNQNNNAPHIMTPAQMKTFEEHIEWDEFQKTLK